MKGFCVTVEGEYIAQSGVMGAERVIQKYQVTCNLPSMERAMSVIRNKLLKPVLAAKYKDFITYRTHNITSIKPLDKESEGMIKKVPVMYMNREALLAVIDSEGLGVEADLYPDLFKLRDAVESAVSNNEAFVKKQAASRSTLIEDQVLAEMNRDVFPLDLNTAQVQVSEDVRPQRESTDKKALPRKAHAKQIDDRVAGLAKDMERNEELKPLDIGDV